jgi:hypothetical protein
MDDHDDSSYAVRFLLALPASVSWVEGPDDAARLLEVLREPSTLEKVTTLMASDTARKLGSSVLCTPRLLVERYAEHLSRDYDLLSTGCASA